MTAEQTFDLIAFIMMNKFELKNEVHEEAIKYLVNMYQAPPSFIQAYQAQFPRYITKRLLNKLSYSYQFNPEELEMLTSALLESEDYRRYFCEEYNASRLN